MSKTTARSICASSDRECGQEGHADGSAILLPWPRWARPIWARWCGLVDFGAFVEIFPGTDGLLHISEIAENRIKEVRDELKEGDQILVKVLALEGNKIKLSRKAVLREQREKLKA